MDRILLNNVLVQCHIGVKDDERQHKQNLTINVVLEADLRPCAAGDSIQQTTNYATTARLVAQYAEAHVHHTLEAFASGLCSSLLTSCPLVRRVTVNVAKPRALGIGGSAAVEVARTRADFPDQFPTAPAQQTSQETRLSTSVPPVNTPERTAPTVAVPQVTICRRETFCAAHRMNSDKLSPEENVRTFGKCNGKHGHGHNYVVEVMLRGPVDPVTGMVCSFDSVKQWLQAVIVQIDHKNIDLDIAYFASVVSTAENIAVWFWNELRVSMAGNAHLLHCVRLYETEKQFVEYYGSTSHL
eukprot:TRINITY_DN68720_c0_g1_i1.p1 TRINITY_DN68720_c0_g1~~TRINITY_DN68720_c0_g1_i1.p1  ORF type:complete len:299 (-),score=43.28 TRINITY_DN68720_c0_g1_i1:106-1002(-)